MKKRFFFLIPFFVFACIQHPASESVLKSGELTDSVEIFYAEGLEITYTENAIIAIAHSIASNSYFSDTLFLPFTTDDLSKSENQTLRNLPSIWACQSSTHLAFLEVLDELSLVKGLCGLNYLNDDSVSDILKDNQVVEICGQEQVSMELLQKVSPDIFLIYPFESTGKLKYNEAGITTFYIAEYLEQTPLGRLEWIKLFGLLTGKVKEANSYFQSVESSYQNLSASASDLNSKFILNLPYKDQWYMPASNSLIVNLIEDAGLSYYYDSGDVTENELKSTETVWSDGMVAPYWIIIASRPENFSLQDLMAEEAIYKEFLSVKQKQVIFCNTSNSDYFVKGVVEPHVLLKDLLFATGQIALHQPQYFHVLK